MTDILTDDGLIVVKPERKRRGASEKQIIALAKTRARRVEVMAERKSINAQIDEDLGLAPGSSDALAKISARTPDESRRAWLDGLLLAIEIWGIRKETDVDKCIPMADKILSVYMEKFFKSSRFIK